MGWGATVPSAAYIWSALGHIPNIARQVQCQNGEVKKQEGLKEARSICRGGVFSSCIMQHDRIWGIKACFN